MVGCELTAGIHDDLFEELSFLQSGHPDGIKVLVLDEAKVVHAVCSELAEWLL